eukprot:TRINITY_DN115350_c0_g1_i1.p1 TRINITY_DN115350_c0_g1~~TRINITY_DN115350_c0_g1_i1.p1  ORF type:complete len:194 (+),score=52.38 TRINITY_DN115350_c0_g1_i1:27-608(+)
MPLLGDLDSARRKRLPPGRCYYLEVGEGGSKRRHCAPAEIQLQVEASFSLLRQSVETEGERLQAQKQRQIKRIIADVYFDSLPCSEGVSSSRRSRLLSDSCGNDDEGEAEGSFADDEVADDQRPLFCSRKKAKATQDDEASVETPSIDSLEMDESEEHGMLAYDASWHEGIVDPWPGTCEWIEEDGHWIPGFA